MYYVYIYLDPHKPGRYCYNNICFLYEPFYIGKGKGRRYKKNDSRNNYFKNKINKIEQFGSEPIFFKLFENLSEEQSFELEKKLIQEIGRIDLKIGTLVNMTDGGEGSSGSIFSEDHKKKMSNSHIGKHHSEESKEKISKKNKGRQLSEECRKKMSERNKGKILSEKTKEKISKKLKNRKFSDDSRLKMSEKIKQRIESGKMNMKGIGSPHFGKHHSEKTKNIISQKLTGRFLSDETKRKISEKMKIIRNSKM